MLLTSPITTALPTGETQVLGVRGSSSVPSVQSATSELTQRVATRRRRGWIFFAVVIALAGLAGGVGWWFAAGPGAEVTITDVRGDTVEVAQAVLGEQGIVVSDVRAEQFDPEIAEGLVARTDPAAGEIIDRDTVITLVISLGREPTSVPDVVGKPEADARLALVGSGFLVGDGIEQFDAAVAEGSVIAVVGEAEAPLAAGDASLKGTPVQLIVSVGAIPSVRGVTVEVAQLALSARQLTGIVGGESEFDNDVELGSVLRVEPTSDAAIRPGSSLTLIISRGADLVDIPNVVGRTINDAVSQLTAAGFEVELDTNVPRVLRDSLLAPVQSTSPDQSERALRGARITVTANF